MTKTTELTKLSKHSKTNTHTLYFKNPRSVWVHRSPAECIRNNNINKKKHNFKNPKDVWDAQIKQPDTSTNEFKDERSTHSAHLQTSQTWRKRTYSSPQWIQNPQESTTELTHKRHTHIAHFQSSSTPSTNWNIFCNWQKQQDSKTEFKDSKMGSLRIPPPIPKR